MTEDRVSAFPSDIADMRALIVRYRWRGHTMRRIAEETGISPETVRAVLIARLPDMHDRVCSKCAAEFVAPSPYLRRCKRCRAEG